MDLCHGCTLGLLNLATPTFITRLLSVVYLTAFHQPFCLLLISLPNHLLLSFSVLLCVLCSSFPPFISFHGRSLIITIVCYFGSSSLCLLVPLGFLLMVVFDLCTL